MKVLVTGGLGNLGSWVTRRLLSRGDEVTVLSRSDRKIPSLHGYRHIACDLTDPLDCRAKLASRSFDAIVHLASANDAFIDDYPRKALLINALGTRNLLEAAAAPGLRRFVYFSTFHVYGRNAGEVTEETPAAPRHDYASTHLFAEEYVRQFHRTCGLNYVNLRLTNGYGHPLDPQSDKWYLLINDLAKMAFEQQVIRLKGNGRAQRDFIWMGDVALAVDAILRAPCDFNDTYNLGSERSWRLIEVAEHVRDAYEKFSGRRLPIETNKEDEERHDEPLVVRCGKLKAKIALDPSDRFESEALAVFELLGQRTS